MSADVTALLVGFVSLLPFWFLFLFIQTRFDQLEAKLDKINKDREGEGE